MTPQEKLKIVIERGVRGGFDWTDSKNGVYEVRASIGGAWFDEEDGTSSYYPTETILFSKDFAKAYWGVGRQGDIDKVEYGPQWNTHYVYCGGRVTEISSFPGYIKKFEYWQYHLARAVLSDNVIDYYYDNYQE